MARMPLPVQVVMSTPVVIGVLDAVVFGAIGGIVAGAAGLSTGPAVGVGVLAGLLLSGLLAVVPARHLGAWKTYRPRFPRPVHTSAPAPAATGAGARPRQGGEPS